MIHQIVHKLDHKAKRRYAICEGGWRDSCVASSTYVITLINFKLLHGIWVIKKTLDAIIWKRKLLRYKVSIPHVKYFWP